MEQLVWPMKMRAKRLAVLRAMNERADVGWIPLELARAFGVSIRKLDPVLAELVRAKMVEIDDSSVALPLCTITEKGKAELTRSTARFRR